MLSGHAPPSPDGVGDYTSRLLIELARSRPDWDWFWIHRRPRWNHAPFLRVDGVNRLRPTRGWTPRAADFLTKIVRWLKPEFLHVQEQIHSFHETGVEARIAERSETRVITTLHEYHIELPTASHTKNLLDCSDVVIANDARTGARSLSHAGRAPDYLWWSGSTVRPADPGWNFETNPNLVTTFGLISAIKGLDLVFEALKIVRATHPDLHWRIIGPYRPHKNALHAELAAKLNVPWVEFTGEFRDLNDRRLRTMLAESRMMLLPFMDGASPRRTTLQAGWAFGLPVITTPPHDNEPSLRDHDNLLFVTRPDPAEWARVIRNLLTDKPLEMHVRQASLHTAREFSWERLARFHLDAYDKLLETS